MKNRGFTLIELLIAIVILVLIAAVVLLSLGSFRARQAVKNAQSEIVSALSLARTHSLNGLNDTVHGVNFKESGFIVFSGATFVANDPGNQATVLPTITLTPNLSGGNSIIFDRLTGATSNAGTIVITADDLSSVATVTVLTSGLISTQ